MCKKIVFGRRVIRRNRHPHNIRVIGLTGSIGMGKSTVARMLSDMRVPVFDADASIHKLMGPKGKALDALRARFPETVGPSGVDRRALGDVVFGDNEALRDLERILHPMIKEEKESFLRQHSLRRTGFVVLDVPLLFETGGDARCDVVLVVTAPKFLQRQRVLSRVGMTEDKLSGILSNQVPDYEKRRRANAVLPSGLGLSVTRRKLNRLFAHEFVTS